MDDDGISADDWMGAVNFAPVYLYNNDNAINFHKTFSNRETTIKIDGCWIYLIYNVSILLRSTFLQNEVLFY